MNELQLVDNVNIKDYIFEIKGKQVMLASDVAKLYNVETFRINEVVKRNIKRFPEEFCFKLSKEESEIVSSRSQFAILNKSGNLRGYNIKYLPYVFTEYGIIMLSGLLKSDIAAYVNVKIISAFVEMRRLLSNNSFQSRLTNVEQKLIEMDNKFLESDRNFETLFSNFKKVENTKLFFDGQIYDAYSLLLDILNDAIEDIIIIDNYIDKSLLDIISKINRKVKIITKNVDKKLIIKYKKQYNNLEIIVDNSYHDRFIIIDKKILYHSGASFKDLGKKCFAINKIDNKEILNLLLNKINM